MRQQFRSRGPILWALARAVQVYHLQFFCSRCYKSPPALVLQHYPCTTWKWQQSWRAVSATVTRTAHFSSGARGCSWEGSHEAGVGPAVTFGARSYLLCRATWRRGDALLALCPYPEEANKSPLPLKSLQRLPGTRRMQQSVLGYSCSYRHTGSSGLGLS